MPAPHAITPEKLSRLVGTAHCPRILDLRNAPERIIPGAVTGVQCGGATDKSVIVVDQEGGTLKPSRAATRRGRRPVFQCCRPRICRPAMPMAGPGG